MSKFEIAARVFKWFILVILIAMALCISINWIGWELSK